MFYGEKVAVAILATVANGEAHGENIDIGCDYPTVQYHVGELINEGHLSPHLDARREPMKHLISGRIGICFVLNGLTRSGSAYLRKHLPALDDDRNSSLGFRIGDRA